jgi:hypothetical protein
LESFQRAKRYIGLRNALPEALPWMPAGTGSKAKSLRKQPGGDVLIT